MRNMRLIAAPVKGACLTSGGQSKSTREAKQRGEWMRRRGPLGWVLAGDPRVNRVRAGAAESLPDRRRVGPATGRPADRRAARAVGKVAIDRDGTHIWAIIRCEPLAKLTRFGDECRDSRTDAVYSSVPTGRS